FHTAGALAAYDIGAPQETFPQLAILCLQEDKVPQLGPLLEAHARAEPNDPFLVRYGYRLKIQQDRVDEAIALFKEALEKQAGQDKRKELVADFLRSMVDGGRAVEGYYVAPDPGHAFQVVAQDLLDQGRADDLRRLLEAHGKRQPEDAWLSYYA